MNIIRTFVPNSFANYNHLVFCEHTQKAAAVDPFSAKHLLDLAVEHKLTIEQIWITHEHGDHIRELDNLKALTRATVYAPKTCQGQFEADVWLQHEQTVKLGESHATHLLTPGHTPGHGVYLANPDNPFVVCADTLFNAGIGNVKSGNVEVLYQTIASLRHRLKPETRLFPGHDYIQTNLNFVNTHFPNCTAARDLLEIVNQQDPNSRSIQTLHQESTYNPFLALNAPWLVSNSAFADLSEQERFVALRRLRDQW